MNRQHQEPQRQGWDVVIAVLLGLVLALLCVRKSRVAPLCAGTSPPRTEPAHAGPGHKESFLTEIITVLVVIGIILSIETAFDRTPLGEQIAWSGYTIALSAVPKPKPAVTIVDIESLYSAYKGKDKHQDQNEAERPVTNRAQLLALVQALKQCHPAAVVLDLDMSADYKSTDLEMTDPQERDADDRKLLSRFDDLCHQGIPAALGMAAGMDSENRNYFLERRYAGMAGNIRILSELECQMNLWVEDSRGRRVPSLASVVCCGMTKRDPADESTALPWLFEDSEVIALPPPPNGVRRRAQVFHVDYSNVDTYIKERVQVRIDKNQVYLPDLRSRPERLTGQVVVIGVANPATRKDAYFAIPGRIGGQIRELPGVYLHAAAIDTLLHRRVYVPTRLGNMLLALLLILAIATTVYWLRVALRIPHTHERAEATMMFVTAFLVYIISLYACAAMRIVWNGMLVTMLFIPVEYIATSVVKWVNQRISSERATP